MEHQITIGVFLTPDEYSNQGYHRIVSEIVRPDTWKCPKAWLEIGRFEATIGYDEYAAREMLVRVLQTTVNSEIGNINRRAEIIGARLTALPPPPIAKGHNNEPRTSDADVGKGFTDCKGTKTPLNGNAARADEPPVSNGSEEAE